uniref:G-protein coupled receptors family 1 profile domain-containing protein n=1 Tax=Cairina moschata TaxID=8855 RepID=A0A8C3CGL2_CAIMO
MTPGSLLHHAVDQDCLLQSPLLVVAPSEHQPEVSQGAAQRYSMRHAMAFGSLAQRQEMCNSSSITEFLLLPFADTRELQLLHFGLFLGIYLSAVLGNSLIITAVACNHGLHTPMYFFLLNLALIDLGSISTSIPKAMANSLWGTRAISYAGCAAQLFLLIFFNLAEFSLLTVMAYLFCDCSGSAHVQSWRRKQSWPSSTAREHQLWSMQSCSPDTAPSPKR